MNYDIIQEHMKPLILIVDDVPRNLQVLGGILRQKSYQISFATSGAKALKMLESIKPDLILLDIMMPEMDGYEVCGKLKENNKTAHVPVIFLTAKTETRDIVKGFETGAVDYVTKPFNPTELVARINTHLALKASMDLVTRQKEEYNELVHVLCHDLMNPIGAAKSILEIIEDYDTFVEMNEPLTAAVDNGLEIIDLVRKIRAITEKKLQLELVPAQLARCVERSLSTLAHRFKQKDIEPVVDIPKDLTAMVEETSFQSSILNNILTNAIKFSKRKSKVMITASGDGDKAVLRVRDHGIGMPDSLIKKVFDINAATSRQGTEGEFGTGFGMPLIKKFVEAYGGDIELFSKQVSESPADQGTEVVITLNQKAAAESTEDPTETEDP